MDKSYEQWIDNIKTLACILVVLGHFFQSMLRSNIIHDSELYSWFQRTIYYFHVRLFFVCSGYLYQRRENFSFFSIERLSFIKHKFISLIIPYISFSCIIWLGRILLSSKVNIQGGNLFDILFVNPTAPYWYLVALFGIFVITPLIRKNTGKVFIIFIGVLSMCLSYGMSGFIPPIINIILGNVIWFVIGMLICQYRCYLDKTLSIIIAFLCLATFLVGSFFTEHIHVDAVILSILMGMMAVLGIAIVEYDFGQKQRHLDKITNMISKYTFPIYLMHTLFAGMVRIILLKIGINHFLIHFICGITASFLGPILYMKLSGLNHMKFLQFIIYPNSLIKRMK